MSQLLRFLVGQTAATIAAHNQRERLASGIVVRVDGAQVMVNVGGQTLVCQPTLGLPLQPGDQVWARIGAGAPLIMGVGTRNSEVL